MSFLFFLPLFFSLLTFSVDAQSPGVRVHVTNREVVMDNGIVQVTLAKPGGFVTGIKYNGIDNILEPKNQEFDRGYWDMVGSEGLESVKGSAFNVIVQNDRLVEVSFNRHWDHSLHGKLVPVDIDLRYVMLKGSSGFYSYAIFDHLKRWPSFSISQIRLVFKPRQDKFHYMAISDKMQRYMPTLADRDPPRGQTLDYKEAVVLVNPVEPQFKGEVDDKYEYSVESKDIKVHGWVATDAPLVGFWQITPSNEFRSGGPNKQELTSHVGPTCLTDFLSGHYVGGDYMTIQVGANEPWNKVYGPVFMYLNSGPAGATPSQLWEDANRQMRREGQKWPYSFPASEDFPKLNQRGSINGRLQVRDRYARNVEIPASNAYVGLALPGVAGSWQTESKGYQFWTTTDRNGYFSIKSVRPGNYNLYAWVPGFIGDYKYDAVINITPGSNVQVNNLVYEPLRDGPTLWEIGIPDRSAQEFYIPDPKPNYINKLYVNDVANRFRQYGLWEKYADLYPRGDLVFTVGTSDYRKDWFYAQVTRKIAADKFRGTTWQIKFKLAQVDNRKTYKMRVAIAGALFSDLQVRVNRPNGAPVFSSGLFGRDNAIARHGIHGLYLLYNIDVPGSRLVAGDNTIFLTQPRSDSPFQGIMYDYIRLEGPPL